MSYQQIRDILKRIDALHHRLHDLIEDVPHDDEDPAAEWLTKYVEVQTRSVSEALQEYQDNGKKHVLETWVQYIPLEELNRHLSAMEERDATTTEELIEDVQEFDKRLRDLYATLAEQSSIPAVQELFSTLSRSAQSTLEQTAWGMRSTDAVDAPPQETNDTE